MDRPIIVTKFGGTSVTEARRRYVAARLAPLVEHGYGVVAVISAVREKEHIEPYSTDALIQLAESINPTIQARERDLLLSCGEIISTTLMAHFVQSHYSWKTVALTGGQAGIVTDYNYGDASIRAIYPDYIRYLLEQGYVVFVAGFQGVTEAEESHSGHHGAITTLGRGGSDATATALGYALGAERTDIYTDVAGVMTADPSLFAGVEESLRPYPLEYVLYEDVCELAHLGAKVVQARAAEIAMLHRVPLRVASTWEECPGTYVVAEEQAPAGMPAVTSVANSERVFHCSFQVECPEDKQEIEAEVMRALGEAGISIYFVNSRPGGCSFVVPQGALEKVKNLLYGLALPLADERSRRYYVIVPAEKEASQQPGFGRVQLQARLLSERIPQAQVRKVALKFGDPARIVSVIGPGLKDRPGVVSEVVGTLEPEGVEVREMAESRNSLSVLLGEHELRTAVQALHTRLVIQKALESKP